MESFSRAMGEAYILGQEASSKSADFANEQ